MCPAGFRVISFENVIWLTMGTEKIQIQIPDS